MRRGCIILAGVVSLVLSGFSGICVSADAETIRIGGAGFGLGVMKKLAEAFEERHPGIHCTVAPSLGSSGGINAAVQGSLDIALSGRPPDAAETARGVVAREIARTPFVFIANNRVRKDGLTIRELEQIYGGQTLSWPDGTRIRPVLRPKKEMDTKIIRGLSPAMDRAMTALLKREGMIRDITDQENADSIERIAGALGAATLTQVLSEKRQVKMLAFNGVKPSVTGVREGSYPLFKVLYLVTTPQASPAARKFSEFARSKEGGAILAQYGNLVMENPKSTGP